MGWFLILIAGCLEVLWPIGMKHSENFTRWGWIVIMMVAMVSSFGLLTLAVGPKFKLPIGTAYAVWTGMGAAGAVVVGLVVFKEPREFGRLFCLALIIIGIVGLKITHREEPPAGEQPPTPPAQQG
ncbi:MAG: multidrug efflux SMR transporter [Planctomycetes bacterium]|nr:multidrug efflux SMR transporter [Planctomycetota bacterium]